jgi:isopentenyl diphosphate isomerase/L-lactate dehydrogenase-like FMN-dependent dehydrogenase
VKGIHELLAELEIIIAELRAALFLTGSIRISELVHRKKVVTGPTAKWLEQMAQ